MLPTVLSGGKTSGGVPEGDRKRSDGEPEGELGGGPEGDGGCAGVGLIVAGPQPLPSTTAESQPEAGGGIGDQGGSSVPSQVDRAGRGTTGAVGSNASPSASGGGTGEERGCTAWIPKSSVSLAKAKGVR